MRFSIGANIGLISVPVAANRQIRVVAFEPDPHNCTLLRANVAVAGVDVTVVNAAVAAERGELRLARSDYNSGDHRLAADGAIFVEALPLGDMPPPPGPCAVKIDTQGAEPLIVAGGERILAGAGLIISEFWPWGMRRMKLDPEPVIEFAERHFGRGAVLRYDEAMGEPEPIDKVVARLRALVASGGEHDAADLVLMR